MVKSCKGARKESLVSLWTITLVQDGQGGDKEEERKKEICYQCLSKTQILIKV